MDGAKLNLLNKVNKVCPEGTEMFLSGGCIKCRKKKDNDFKFKDSVKRFAKDEEVVEKHQDGGKSEIPSIPYNRNRFKAVVNEYEKLWDLRKKWNNVDDSMPKLSTEDILYVLTSKPGETFVGPVGSASYQEWRQPSTLQRSTEKLITPDSIEEVRTVESTKSNESKPKSFTQAFAEAKRNGLDVFEWNEKKFTTETKEEQNARLTARRNQSIEPAATRFETIVVSNPVAEKELQAKAELNNQVDDLINQIASIIRPEGADINSYITRKEQRGINREIRQDRRIQRKEDRLNRLKERFSK